MSLAAVEARQAELEATIREAEQSVQRKNTEQAERLSATERRLGSELARLAGVHRTVCCTPPCKTAHMTGMHGIST